MGEVTQLLEHARRGDRAALERFYARIYKELEVIARSQLGRQGPMTLIDPSSLINEVYLRISRQESLPGENRGAFFAYASSVMRSVIVDYLRARSAERRGGDQIRVTLGTDIEKHESADFEFRALSEVLKSLQGVDERAHRVVEMRYFGGMEIEEIAQFLQISPATVKRDWTKARLFLRHQLANETEHHEQTARRGIDARGDGPARPVAGQVACRSRGAAQYPRAFAAGIACAGPGSARAGGVRSIAASWSRASGPATQSGLRADMRLGPYRIIRLVGEGGMGEVWLASRDDGLYEGQVAIKTLHPYFAGGALRDRFLREAKVLGRLAHSNIARLLDAGIQDGVVYLVLEYVSGRPLDVACDEEQLGIPARLRIFGQLCAGVAHAHSSLVIHRDIKPGNVLLTADGVPKLLDFGIANFYEPEAGGQPSDLTRLTGRIFTPEYAAPEQVLGQEITTATDVYSLGMLLYVLLAGKLPYEVVSRERATWEHSVVHQEPQRMVRTVDAGDHEALTRNRATTFARLRRELGGDLENIVQKALKKRPEDRYPTVAAFADDVRRYLDGEPVLGARGLGLVSPRKVRATQSPRGRCRHGRRVRAGNRTRGVVVAVAGGARRAPARRGIEGIHRVDFPLGRPVLHRQGFHECGRFVDPGAATNRPGAGGAAAERRRAADSRRARAS